MAGVKHTKVLEAPDDGEEDKAYGVDWNAEHALSDVASQASLDAVSNAVSVVSNALSVETAARVAADNALSNAVSVVSQALSVETVARVEKDDALSQAVSVLSHALSVLSNANSAEHAALSLRIDGAGGDGSVTSAEVQVASAAATSADAHANAASAAATSVDARVNTVSAAVNTVSAALANEISVRASAVSTVSHAVSVLSQANSVAHAALSNAISATSAALSERASALSQAISVLSNTNSVEHAALSDAIAAIPGGGSARDRARWISVANSTTTSVLGNISGLSMAVSAGGLYQMEARLLINRANTSTPLGLGLTFPSMKRVRGAINMITSNVQSAAGAVSSRPSNNAFNGDSASGSVIMSQGSSSIAYLSTQAMLSGVFFASAGGVIQLQGRGSATGGGGITFLEGSYIRVIRIN